MTIIRFIGIMLMGLLMTPAVFAAGPLPLDGLEPVQIEQVKQLITELEPLIRERDERQDLARLTFDELYAPLDDRMRTFLRQFQDLDPKAVGVSIPFRGIATGEEDLVQITGQAMTVGGEEQILPPQFLPRNVYAAYEEMMIAMEKDLDRRLLVESGYRSSAYQLYLFVYYLKNHEYSIRETAKFVALPGFSEHGAPEFQAIDFINVEGINGEDDPSEFDVLPEYAWLQGNAGRFGFALSYPRISGSNITYEPWHWRYEQGKVKGEK